MFLPKIFQIPQMFLLKMFQIPQMFLPKMFQIPQMFGQNRGKIYRWVNTSRPSPGSQIKDFGTKTHFFSKKKWEKVRFRAILRSKYLCHNIWCCLWHPFKYSKQRSHTRQSLSRMTHRRKRIFSSLKKRKKVGRVFDGGISLHVRLSETEINLKIRIGAYIAPITCLCPHRKAQIHEKKCDNY